jgi:hypothetical protein
MKNFSGCSTFYMVPFELCGRTIGQLAMATLFSSTVITVVLSGKKIAA